MKAVNLLPPELRPRVPGEGDPRVAWGVLGALGALLLVVIISIGFSNKAKTLNDEATAMKAEAQQIQAATAIVPTSPDTVTQEVKNRTLLVGGLSAVRFPWNTAMSDLSKSLPPDVTIDTLVAASATPADAADTTMPAGSMQPTMTLTGCTSGWVGYSRLLTWLKQMPGVQSVRSTSSAISTAAPEPADGEKADPATSRTENCGPQPLAFSLSVAYRPKSADLLGLPRPQAAAGSGATGPTATPAAGVPAAAATPGG